MFYDLNAGEPMVDWEHVIVENVNRLPGQLLEENCPEGFRIEPIVQMNSQERQDYVSRFRDAIRKDSQAYRSMKNRFRDGVNITARLLTEIFFICFLRMLVPIT